MRRVVSAREQIELHAPWLLTAAPGDITPGAGLPMSPSATPPPGRPTSGPAPVIPQAPAPTIPEGDWVKHPDWRNATDGLAFHSTVRPPLVSDIPHPSEVLRRSNPDHRSPRVVRITNQRTGEVTDYHLKSWIQQARESADPINDPWGVQTPPHKIIHYPNGIPRDEDGNILTNKRGVPLDRDGRWRAKNTIDVTDQGWQPNVSPTELVANRVGHELNVHDDDQIYRSWYRVGHEETKNLAEKTHGDHERVTHTISAWSPRTRWDENMEKGWHWVLNHRPSGVGPGIGDDDPGFPDPEFPGLSKSPAEKSRLIYKLPDGEFQKVNSGEKTKNFAINLTDKTPEREPRPGIKDDYGYYQMPINPYTGERDYRLHSDQNHTSDTHDVRMAHTTPQQPGEDRETYLDRLRGLSYGVPVQFAQKLTWTPERGRKESAQDYHDRLKSLGMSPTMISRVIGSPIKPPARMRRNPKDPTSAADESHEDYFKRLQDAGFSPTMDPKGFVRPGKALLPPKQEEGESNEDYHQRLTELGHNPQWHHRVQPGKGIELEPGYNMMVRSSWEARRILNAMQPDELKHMVPKQGQSLTWNGFKRDLDEAKNKSWPEPGMPPKSWDPDDPNWSEESWIEDHPLDPRWFRRYRYDHRNEAGEPWHFDPRLPRPGDDNYVPIQQMPGYGFTPSHMIKRKGSYDPLLAAVWDALQRTAFVKFAFDWQRHIDVPDLEFHKATLENGHELHAWQYTSPEAQPGWNWAIAKYDDPDDYGHPELAGYGAPDEYHWLAAGGRDAQETAREGEDSVLHGDHIHTLDEAKHQAQEAYKKMFPIGGPGTGSHDSGVDYSQFFHNNDPLSDDYGDIFGKESRRRLAAETVPWQMGAHYAQAMLPDGCQLAVRYPWGEQDGEYHSGNPHFEWRHSIADAGTVNSGLAPSFELAQAAAEQSHQDMHGWDPDTDALDPREFGAALLASVDEALRVTGSLTRQAAPSPSAIYVLLPHWDPESAAQIMHDHAAAHAAGIKIAIPVMDKQWMGDVMGAAREGGFTLHDHVGDGPKQGYMVSLTKDQEFKRPMEELTADHIRDFVNANAEALERPHHYLGGWLEGGHFYLDVSKHIPDLNRATAEAVRNKQLGIYDLNNGRTMYTEEAGALTGHPGVLGSRNRAQGSTAVSLAAQERPGPGAGHPAGSSRASSLGDPDEYARRAAHLDLFGYGG